MNNIKNVSYKNRGMSLENDINKTNMYYLEKNKAVFNKRPTPVKVIKVEYIDGFERIVNAFFEKPSTTDYYGVYKGHYIDFEAKETNSKTSFPLTNIHKHQWEHMNNVLNHGGISFLIVRFSKLNKTFFIQADDIVNIQKEKKSIPLSLFEEKGVLIKEKLNNPVDYLPIIQELYFKGEEYAEKESK